MLDCHYGKQNDKKRGNILVSLIFDSDLREIEVGIDIATIVASTVTHFVVTPQVIAKSIDLNYGSLNNLSVSEIACIKINKNIFSLMRSYSLLPFCNRITEVYNFMNDFSRYLFLLQHNIFPKDSSHSTDVAWDYESLVHLLVQEYGLDKKALY